MPVTKPANNYGICIQYFQELKGFQSLRLSIAEEVVDLGSEGYDFLAKLRNCRFQAGDAIFLERILGGVLLGIGSSLALNIDRLGGVGAARESMPPESKCV